MKTCINSDYVFVLPMWLFFLQAASIFFLFIGFFTILSIKYFFPQNRSSGLEVFCKKCVLSISQKWQKTPVQESFLSVKLQHKDLKLYENETPAQVFSCEFCSKKYFARKLDCTMFKWVLNTRQPLAGIDRNS